MRVKCIAGTTRSGNKPTNHEASAPPLDTGSRLNTGLTVERLQWTMSLKLYFQPEFLNPHIGLINPAVRLRNCQFCHDNFSNVFNSSGFASIFQRRHSMRGELSSGRLDITLKQLERDLGNKTYIGIYSLHFSQ